MTFMNSIYESLLARREELPGRLADVNDLERLADRLSSPIFAPLFRIFRELRVCETALQVVVDEQGECSSPGPDFMDDDSYDPDTEHDFFLAAPDQILFDLEEAYAGPAAFAAGYLFIGMPTAGGDDYYVKISDHSTQTTPLYEVYHDWIDPTSSVPVPPEAVKLIANSLEDVIKVATMYRA